MININNRGIGIKINKNKKKREFFLILKHCEQKRTGEGEIIGRGLNT